ncbi:hypothetical protein NFI96_001098 [Prochilodus magdalenae]|nr:hypothetical protein NFI96_001098 [Prochilodus magdalenae]
METEWGAESAVAGALSGSTFKIETDHKPLVPLLSSKALDELPPRVLRFRLRLLKFTYDIVHVPGKCLITADALSRAPVKHTFTQEEKDNEADVKVFVDTVVQSLPATEARLKVIQDKQKVDPVCAKLIKYCQTEWPDKHALPPDLGPYWPERENLSLVGELLLRGQRIVVPQSMRQEVLRDLHSGHQGIVKCRARARQSVWWPGLSVHISQLVENCSICSQHLAEHREPLMPTPVQDRPWQRVGTDLFFWEKKTYLLVVDYFSRYIEVAHLSVATAETVIAALKDTFSRHGIPETVMSDNGPQYSCELFRDFAKEYGFTHCTSSPRYAQANGEAERAVATIKGLWKGGEEKLKALMTYRATPLECGYSPAQLLMGRQLRTTIPQLPTYLHPRWPNIRGFRKAEMRAKENQQRNYNRRHRARHLQPLQAGQKVWLAKEKKSGTVIQQATTPRSYIIDTDEGQLEYPYTIPADGVVGVEVEGHQAFWTWDDNKDPTSDYFYKVEKEQSGSTVSVIGWKFTDRLKKLAPHFEAFDTVNHKIFLSVLTNLGITGTTWKWFESYLEDRHYQVTWKGSMSAPWRLSMGSFSFPSSDTQFLIHTLIFCWTRQVWRVQHRDLALSLCSETEKQKIMGLDGEEMWHADFRQGRGVITLPDFADPFSFPDAYGGAVSQQTFCKQSLDVCKEAYGNPPEPKVAPKLSIYPKSDVQLGSKNTVICYITGFYPPEITVSWYRGDEDVTNQATFSRYHLTSDRTFNLVSHLSFNPVHGDTYTCTVRHTALNGPLGKVWDGYYFFMTDECITSSSSLSDAEYIETFYFNRDPFVQFNSTVGEYVGFNELGVYNADIWNKGNEVVLARAYLTRICKPNLRLFYSSVLEKSVKPTVKLTIEEQDAEGQPSMLMCSAYDFYPPAIDVSWLIQGVKVKTKAVTLEEMADGDWYYQVHSHIEYTPKSGERISCVVEHVSSNEPIGVTWSDSPSGSDNVKIGVGVTALVVGIILSVAGAIYYFKKKYSGKLYCKSTNSLTHSSVKLHVKIAKPPAYSPVKVHFNNTSSQTYDPGKLSRQMRYKFDLSLITLNCLLNSDTVLDQTPQTFLQPNLICPKDTRSTAVEREEKRRNRHTPSRVLHVKPTVKLTSEEQSNGDQPAKLICSAYDFYPPAIEVSWLIDGKKVTTDVVYSEEMANGDWYYQIHSHLVYTPSKSGEKISCVVEHASSNKPIIQDWSESLSESDTIKIGVGVSVLVVGIILSVAGSICYCRKKS